MQSKNLRHMVRSSPPSCIVLISREGKILDFNKSAEAMFGHQPRYMIGRKLTDAIVPVHLRRYVQRWVKKTISERKLNETGSSTETVVQRADGTCVNVELLLLPGGTDGDQGIMAFLRDISAQRKNFEFQLEKNRILQLIATGTSLDEILACVERVAASQLGVPVAIYRHSVSEHLYLNNGSRALTAPVAINAMLADSIEIDDVAAGLNITPTAQVTPASEIMHSPGLRHLSTTATSTLTSLPIIGKEKNLLGRFALRSFGVKQISLPRHRVILDCTQLAALAIESCVVQERMRLHAYHDELTLLPNRFLYDQCMDTAMTKARQAKKKFAVLFLDLDKFKEVNDTYGHAVGDRVLQIMAMRLRDCLRHTDMIARIGGDEFNVLIEALADGHQAAEVARKLLEAAHRPVIIDGRSCQLSASIGIAVFPDDGVEKQVLQERADSAMYRAKTFGKNAYRFYSPHRNRPRGPIDNSHHELQNQIAA